MKVQAKYELVTRAAFEWGFDKSYGPNWNGDEDIRDGLIDAAKAANESAHGVLSAAFLEFVGGKSLPDLPRWYSHDLRLLVMNLLANTNCMDSADGLAAAYDRINEASH